MGLRNTLLTGLIATLGLGACAGGDGRYPSLALREAERRPQVMNAPDAGPPAAAEPASVDGAQIAALRASAESAHAAFVKKQPAAATLVARARGGAADSSARSAALVALADLTAQRSATFVPLGELDRIAADTAAAYGDTAPARAAQAAVAALVAQQDASLDALWRDLGS
jgi:hypothetical protein